MDKVSAFFGLATPSDFPIDVYDEVAHRLGNFPGLNRDHLREFLGAWQAVAYRSIACAKYDAKFTELMTHSGFGFSIEQQYLQDQYLFNFFINGLSIIESLSYALFAIGSLVEPTKFLITTAEEKKAITLKKTKNRFIQEFINEPITILITALIDSQELKDLEDIRNVLVHRGVPSRIVSISTTNKNYPDIWRVEMTKGITLDINTIVARRLWLNNQLSALITDINVFTQKYLI